jgi:hypothetical protein
VSGAALSLLSLAWDLTVQEKVPEHMLSRILAIDGFFSFVATPIGLLAAGPLAEVFGMRAVLLGAFGLAVLVAVVGSTRPLLTRVRLTGVPVDEAPS